MFQLFGKDFNWQSLIKSSWPNLVNQKLITQILNIQINRFKNFKRIFKISNGISVKYQSNMEIDLVKLLSLLKMLGEYLQNGSLNFQMTMQLISNHGQILENQPLNSRLKNTFLIHTSLWLVQRKVNYYQESKQMFMYFIIQKKLANIH